MTNNIDPRLRLWLEQSKAVAAWRTVDDSQAVVLRFRSGATIEIKAGLPGRSRSSCPDGACGYVTCTQHLWLQRGHERAGRRVQGKTPDTTLRALTLEHDAPPASCALHEADAVAATGEPMAIAEVGRRMNLRGSQVWALQQSALRKLKAHGVPLEDLMMGER